MKFILRCITGVCMSQVLFATVFLHRPDVQQFIDEVADQHQLDKQQLTLAFGQIGPSEEVITRMTTQYEALPWHKYRKLFMTDKRIDGGIEFWKQYHTELTRAEKEYGVPAELIVAIIGIESTYGQNRGKYPVMQALATLAFDYPPRAAFFRNELKEYLLLVTEQRLDPLALTGSYAGAIGIPQFIASSYRNFAVDFDNSGSIDLINNMPQVIGSVANFFKVHGWQSGQPIISKAVINGDKYKQIAIAARHDPQPIHPLSALELHGVDHTHQTLDSSLNFAWLEFDNDQEKEYWLGFPNFYVITRYNHSSNYALAVHQLGEAIAQKYKP